MISEQVLVVLIIAGTLLTPTDGSVVVSPRAVSVGEGLLLPLSCVTSGGESTYWLRNGQQLVNTTQTQLLAELYTSTNGRQYTITTLVLCSTRLQDAGLYSCGADNRNNSFPVDVHRSTRARFELRLTGVTSCGDWNADSNTRSARVLELTTQLRQGPLIDLCSTVSQQCSLDIVEPSFGCPEGIQSSTVLFTGAVQISSSSVSNSLTAEQAVAIIDEWQRTDGQSVSLGFQSLGLEQGCSNNSCNANNATSIQGAGLNETAVPWVVGGAVIAVFILCITLVLLVLIIAVVRRSAVMVRDKSSPSRGQTRYSSPPDTLITNLGPTQTLTQPSDTLERNSAYGKHKFSESSNVAYSREGSQIDANAPVMNNPVYEDIADPGLAPVTPEDDIYD